MAVSRAKTQTSAASSLRRLISGRGIVVAPGVFSPIVAQLAERAGFKALYFSGGGFANLLGMPDLGVTTLTEVSEATRRIISVSELPLIVDVDTGFGEAVNVMRTVGELGAAGAAGAQIEDQVMPKRCGHLEGKEVVETDEMVKKLISAKEANKGDIVLIARTDARAVEGFDSAVERAKAYLKAGAEVIFPEALESGDEFREFRKKVKAPLLANMTEFGKTPYMSASDFEEMGYNIVIFPMTPFRAMLKSVKKTLEALKSSGTQKGILKDLMTRNEIYEVIDYYGYEQADKRAMETARRLDKEDTA